MKKKSYGKLLIASALSVVLCAFMLAGATWAWFTDSVTSAGNRIQAGTLKISAASASIDPAATEKPFAIADFNDGEAFGFGTSQSLETAGPIIGETNWEPGKGNAKLLSVKNAGSLAAKIKLRFTVTDGGLADALWFDFVQVSADNAVTGTFTRRPMSTLSTFAKTLELPLARENDEVRFLFLYGMNEGAGNDYQAASFEVSVTILAKQMSAEADGFGDADYDKESLYYVSVTTPERFTAAVAAGENISLAGDVALTESLTTAGDMILDLNGQSLTLADGTASLKAAVGTTLKIQGNGTINGVVYADSKFGNGSTVIIDAGTNFVVNSQHAMGYAVYGGAGTTLQINGGTYNSSQEGFPVKTLGKKLEIRNATVNVLSASVLDSKGIQTSAAENYLENVTVHGNYSTALDITGASAVTTVRGGLFETTRVADSEFGSDTIQYKGTLDISDATIRRVKNGIFYAVYQSTSAEGLTMTNCIFEVIESSLVGDFKDVNWWSV